MLIFLAILLAEVLATRVPVNRLLHSMHGKQGLEAWSAVVAMGILALLVLVATAIMAKIEKRPVLHTDSWANEGRRASFWALRQALWRSPPWFWL
jgi:hypothetical protein